MTRRKEEDEEGASVGTGKSTFVCVRERERGMAFVSANRLVAGSTHHAPCKRCTHRPNTAVLSWGLFIAASLWSGGMVSLALTNPTRR